MAKVKKLVALVLAMATIGVVMSTSVFAAQTVQATMTSNASKYSAWSTGSGYAQGYGQGINQSSSASSVRMIIKMSTYPNSTQNVWNNTLGSGSGWVNSYTYPTGNNTSVYQVQLSTISGNVSYAIGKVSPR